MNYILTTIETPVYIFEYHKCWRTYIRPFLSFTDYKKYRHCSAIYAELSVAVTAGVKEEQGCREDLRTRTHSHLLHHEQLQGHNSQGNLSFLS